MANRIQVWPPGGGDPITVYEADSENLISKGWTTEPSAKSKGKKDAAAPKKTSEEGK